MANILENMNYVQQQGALGRQQGTNRLVSRLTPDVLRGDPAAYTQVAQADPKAAVALQETGDRQYRRLQNVTKLMQQAIDTGNPQAKAATFRTIRPFMSEFTGKPLDGQEWTDEMLPGFQQFAQRVQMAEAGSPANVQSTRIGADGYYWTVDRAGNWTNSGVKADPKAQLRDVPGLAPGIVDLRAGTISPLSEAGQPAPLEVGEGSGALRMDIEGMDPQRQQAMAQAVSSMQAMGLPQDQIDAFISQAMGQPQNVQTRAPQPGLADARPAISPAEQERLRLSAQADARAAEANRRAEDAARRAEDAASRGTIPSGFRLREDGSLEPIPGGPKPAGAAATEGERKAATLLQRLNSSTAQLEAAVRDDPEARGPSVLAEVGRSLPLIGDFSANALNSPERQRVEAAQLDILDAALTLGTGAAYTREQLEGYRRSYFPQLGDSEATKRDKSDRLQNVIEAARIAAGRAAPAVGTDSATPMQPQAAPRRLRFNPATGRIE